MLIVLYNIMSFTYASKNSADTSNNQQGKYASVIALKKKIFLFLEGLNLHDGQKAQNDH